MDDDISDSLSSDSWIVDDVPYEDIAHLFEEKDDGIQLYNGPFLKWTWNYFKSNKTIKCFKCGDKWDDYDWEEDEIEAKKFNK